MAIILWGPTRETRFEFEVNTDNQIQIRSIIEPENSEDAYTLGPAFLYRLEAIRDLYLWLKNERNGEWVFLNTRNEYIGPNERPLRLGSVEAWARPPVNNWYGLSNNQRGRFATFIPPILEYLGLAEVEHNPRNNRMRAL